MHQTYEDSLQADDVAMRAADREGNARLYVNLCDRLGIPQNARNPHLQYEGAALIRKLGISTARTVVSQKPEVDVSGCQFSQASIDYLHSLDDVDLERKDYLTRIRQFRHLGGVLPASLVPEIGAPEDNLRILYFALASKARSLPRQDAC